MRVFFCYILIILVLKTVAILPPYTSALQRQGENDNLQVLITNYFNQGYNNFEILAFLSLLHGIVMSLRSLKRWLRRWNLKRANRRNEASLEDIVSAILVEMERSVGSFVGYREMTRRLRMKYNLIVRRDTVMRAMRVIDADGVEARKHRRLKRRKYNSPGPNFLWHIDGWDKLKPYGFSVHACIDGFSRRLLWLEVSTTNKNPNVIVDYFLSTVQQLGGVPRLVRTDKGTENVWIAVMQKLLRMNQNDALAGHKSFIEGKSSANQRIEAYWSKLRLGGGGWWMDFFKDLRDSGVYADHDPLHQECLKFCFMNVLRNELNSIAKMWNVKDIHVKKNAQLFGGKPDVMYFLPDVYGKRNYLVPTNEDDVQICRDLYGETRRDYTVEFENLVNMLIPGVGVPESTEQGLELFRQIIGQVNELMSH